MSKLSYEQMLRRIRIAFVIVLTFLALVLLLLFGCHARGG